MVALGTGCMARARVTLEIIGLGCGGGGALTVERALAHISGVVYAYTNPAMETAYVEYETTLVEPEKLVAAVEQLGFRAGVPVPR
jgi:copper chaperone CopZ